MKMQQHEAELLAELTDLMSIELHDKVAFLIPTEKVQEVQDDHGDIEITSLMLGYAVMQWLACRGIIDSPYFKSLEDMPDETD